MKETQAGANKRIKIATMLLLMAVAVLMYIYMAYISYQRSENPGGIDAYFVLQNIVYILLLFLLGYVCIETMTDKKKKAPIERIFLIAGFVLGFTYMLVLPLMAAPDEYTHMYAAYDMSDTLMGNHSDTLMMREADAIRKYNQENLERADFNRQYADAFEAAENKEVIKTNIETSLKPRYLFFVSGLGITIGRLLGLSTTLTFLLGRMCNLLFFILCTYYAIKRMPFGKGVVMIWALLPITLQQACSFSYDAPIYAFSILIIATTLSEVYGEENNRRAKIKNRILLLFSCILLLPCKGYSLLPLVVFPLMLIPKYLREHRDKVAQLKEKIKPWMKWTAGLLLAAFVALFFLALVRVIRQWMLPENINSVYIAWADENGFTIGYFIQNPVHFFEIIINTIWYKSEELLRQMLGGSLGWLEIQIPLIFSIGFMFLLVYTAIRKENETQLIRNGERFWMVLVFVGVSSLAVLAMLLYWTPASSAVVQGVQGRYFLPALVLGLLALRTKTTCVSANSERYAAMWMVFLHMLVVTAVFREIP